MKIIYFSICTQIYTKQTARCRFYNENVHRQTHALIVVFGIHMVGFKIIAVAGKRFKIFIYQRNHFCALCRQSVVKTKQYFLKRKFLSRQQSNESNELFYTLHNFASCPQFCSNFSRLSALNLQNIEKFPCLSFDFVVFKKLVSLQKKYFVENVTNVDRNPIFPQRHRGKCILVKRQ